MTTENNPRGLGELLSMDTYQEMTDAEIQMIIDHEKNKAYNAGNLDALKSETSIAMQAAHKQYEAVSQKAVDVLQSLERARDTLFGEVNS